MSLGLLTSGGDGFQAPGVSDFWQPLIGDGEFATTRPMVLMALSVVILTIVMVSVSRNLSVVPSKVQFFFEQLYAIPRNAIARDMIGEDKFRPYIPFLVTLFLLILVNNLFGNIPGIQYPTMSRIGFAMALTLIVYLVYLGIGFRKHGPIGFFSRMIPKGVPGFVVPVLLILEIITYFVTRPLTLALRLFANMFAGHMLLLVFVLGGEFLLLHGGNIAIQATGIVGFLMAILMAFFELLVQFLQAYVFVLLTAFYIADALSEEH